MAATPQHSGTHLLQPAKVVLEVIDPPRRPVSRVDPLVAKGGGPALARDVPRARVDPEEQPLRVDVVAERLHAAREPLGVGLQVPVRAALRRHPAIIYVHVPIPSVPQAGRHDGIGHLLDAILVQALAAHRVPRCRAGRKVSQVRPKVSQVRQVRPTVAHCYW